MAEESKELRLEITWPDALRPYPANVFRISRLGTEVQIRVAYVDLHPVVEAFASGQPSVGVKVSETIDLTLGSAGFLRLYTQMREIYEAMAKSGHMPDSEGTPTNE